MNPDLREIACTVQCFSQSDGDVFLQAVPDNVMIIPRDLTLALLSTVLLAIASEGNPEKIYLVREHVKEVLK